MKKLNRKVPPKKNEPGKELTDSAKTSRHVKWRRFSVSTSHAGIKGISPRLDTVAASTRARSQSVNQIVADVVAELAAYILAPTLRHGDAF